MAGERVLTAGERNRALLARQCLLARGSGPLPRLVERVGLVQSQYAPSMYVGLWSRMEGLERDAVSRALHRRTVVLAWMMRVTIHLSSRRDFWPIALAVRDARRAVWLQSRKGAVSVAAMEAAAEALRERLLAEGPQRGTEIGVLVGKERAAGVGLWLDLVRVPPSGTWEHRRADLFGLAEDWVGPPGDATAEQGVELLVRRYLGGFGPATRGDIAGWCGLRVGDVAPVLERIELRAFADEAGRTLLDLPRGPLPPADTPAPARFLPTFDATLLVHCRAAQILREEHRSLIFSTQTPHSSPTFLVDGTVAGTWRLTGGRVELKPFGRLDPADRRELMAEAERLAQFHA